MNLSERERESLANAFAARPPSNGSDACPEPGRIYDAVAGTLNVHERMQILDHVAQCAECAEAWKIAKEMDAGSEVRAQPWHARLTSFGSLQRVAMAATVVMAVAFTLIVAVPRTDEAAQYRTASDSNIPIAQSADRLSRDAFTLRWTPGPAKSTYALRVSTADLRMVFSRSGITQTQFVVPRDSLESVASGTQLLWQVEAHTPQGDRIVSDTFVVTLR